MDRRVIEVFADYFIPREGESDYLGCLARLEIGMNDDDPVADALDRFLKNHKHVYGVER